MSHHSQHDIKSIKELNVEGFRKSVNNRIYFAGGQIKAA